MKEIFTEEKKRRKTNGILKIGSGHLPGA